MAGQLLLINPRKRRRRKNPETRSERSRAAKLGWRRRRHTSHKRRRHNPESRRERSAAARRGWAHRRHNPIRHHRRRRNPIGRKMGFFAPIMPAALGAVGALGLSVLWGYAPIPTTWKTGTMGYAAKGMGALALGAALGMVMKKTTAESLTVGMVTVVLADALKGIVQTSMPTIPLGEIQPDYGMGYISPAAVVNDQPQSLTYQGTNAINNMGYDVMAQAGVPTY